MITFFKIAGWGSVAFIGLFVWHVFPDIQPVIIGIALVFGWPLWNSWRERGLQKEYERNPHHTPPETDQLKWAVRHIREDINLLCHLMSIAVVLLAIIAFKK